MANKILITEPNGTPKQIVLADHAGDFNPAAANDLRDATAGNRENVQLAVASVANTAARQSAKFDFGDKWARQYAIRGALELALTPANGEVCEIYIGYSQTATAANGNMGNLSGVDGVYTGYSSNLADTVKQLDWIGNFVCTDDATGTVQIAYCRTFRPKARYGCVVFKNESGASIHSDDVECHIVFDPLPEELQSS